MSRASCIVKMLSAATAVSAAAFGLTGCTDDQNVNGLLDQAIQNELPQFEGLTAIDDVTATSVLLRWKAYAEAEHFQLYDVSEDQDEGKPLTTVPAGESTFRLTDLKPQTEYKLRLHVLDRKLKTMDVNKKDIAVTT